MGMRGGRHSKTFEHCAVLVCFALNAHSELLNLLNPKSESREPEAHAAQDEAEGVEQVSW